MTTKIKSPNYTSWGKTNDTVRQPNGINYDDLIKKVAKIEKDVEKNIVQDYRKPISKQSSEQRSDESIEKIDKNSMIPVPGMLIEYENSESDWMPSSEWQMPKGNVWGQ